MSSIMFGCSPCGLSFPPPANFCPSCGNKLQPQNSNNNQPSEPAPALPPRKSPNGGMSPASMSPASSPRLLAQTRPLSPSFTTLPISSNPLPSGIPRAKLSSDTISNNNNNNTNNNMSTNTSSILNNSNPSSGSTSSSQLLIINSLTPAWQVCCRLILHLQGLSNSPDFVLEAFTSSTSPEAVQSLINIVLAGEGLTASLNPFPVSALVSVVKKMFMSRFPLFPKKFFRSLIDLQTNQASSSIPFKCGQLSAIITLLPKDNRIMLSLIFRLLASFKNRYTDNTPYASKLAYTFAPLLTNSTETVTDLKSATEDIRKLTALFTDMIENASAIFQSPEAEISRLDNKDTSKCSVCKVTFGILNSAKTCYICAGLFCAKDSDNRINGERTCNECYDLHK